MAGHIRDATCKAFFLLLLANSKLAYMLIRANSDVGRTIGAASTTDADMTNEECTSYCFGLGFPYAGTEYYTQCYCGSSLATGGTNATVTDCNTPCGGNSTEACGGPNRLTLYKSSKVTGPQVNPGPNGWVSQGCYA